MTHNNRGKRRTNPLPATIRRAREIAGLTQSQAAALLYTTGHVWSQWETDPANVSSRRMHPAFWELFLTKTKLLDNPELDDSMNDKAP